jgi:hypothetical protein
MNIAGVLKDGNIISKIKHPNPKRERYRLHFARRVSFGIVPMALSTCILAFQISRGIYENDTNAGFSIFLPMPISPGYPES